ncbi:DUF6301 family protein [Nocardia sp. NPDC055321]
MSEVLRVDFERAAEIVTAVTQFEWTWSLSEVPGLVSRLGWTESQPIAGVETTLLTTGLDIRQPMAHVMPASDAVYALFLQISDSCDDADMLAAASADTRERCVRRWGEPSEEFGRERWSLPGLELCLASGSTSLSLSLENPTLNRQIREQRAAAEQPDAVRARAERRAALVDRGPLLRAIPVFTGARLETWSRAEVDVMFEAIGWPLRRDDESDVEAELETADSRSILYGSKTPSYVDSARFEFGEFDSVWTSHYFAPDSLDAAYSAALVECVRVLGPPPVVGGPDATAIWRRPDTTFTLSRSSLYSAVHLSIAPSEPTENLGYWEWKWSDDWRAPDRWQLFTDFENTELMNGVLGPNNWWGPEPHAADWPELESRITELFTSLAADLPLLRPHVSDLMWVLDRADAEPFVQGFFSVEHGVCYFEAQDGAGTTLHTLTVPIGGEGGRELAAATVAALRETLPGLPEELRYRAWCSGEQRLHSIRFGLPRS